MEYSHPRVSPVEHGIRAVPLLQLPRYLWWSIQITALFAVAIALLIGTARAEELPASLFVTFRDAFLSQTTNHLTAYRFTCHVAEVFAASFGEDSCRYAMFDGPFSQVSATVIDGTSRTLTFTVRRMPCDSLIW